MTDERLTQLLASWGRNEPEDVAFVWQSVDELIAEVRRLEAESRALRARLRSVAQYADGLHFAGRLKDEKIVRAALGPEPVAEEGPDLDLLYKFATGIGGRRTGALKRAGFLEWRVTDAGYRAIDRGKP